MAQTSLSLGWIWDLEVFLLYYQSIRTRDVGVSVRLERPAAPAARLALVRAWIFPTETAYGQAWRLACLPSRPRCHLLAFDAAPGQGTAIRPGFTCRVVSCGLGGIPCACRTAWAAHEAFRHNIERAYTATLHALTRTISASRSEDDGTSPFLLCNL